MAIARELRGEPHQRLPVLRVLQPNGRGVIVHVAPDREHRPAQRHRELAALLGAAGREIPRRGTADDAIHIGEEGHHVDRVSVTAGNPRQRHDHVRVLDGPAIDVVERGVQSEGVVSRERNTYAGGQRHAGVSLPAAISRSTIGYRSSRRL